MTGFGISLRGAFAPGTVLDATLATCAALGADAVLAPSAFELSPSLDAARLREARERVHDHGLRLGVGLHFLHPYRVHADSGLLEAGDGNAFLGLQRGLEAIAGTDDPDIQFVLGDPADRENPIMPWPDQLDALARLLERLAPTVRSLGIRLCLKTHEEITTHEIVRLVDRVGADVLRIGFDPVNCLVRWETAEGALSRIAGALGHVYYDDAVFCRAGAGFDRLLCPVGDGVLDWPALHAGITGGSPDARWWIDLHKGQFGIAPFDPAVPALHPDLGVQEYAALYRLALRSSESLTAERTATLRAAQPRPWDRLGEVAATLARLREPALV